MHFDLDDDERALRDGIRQLAAGRITMSLVRASADSAGVDRAMWSQLAEAGVFSLTMREQEGGLGLGTTHACVVFEELGRVLAPGPLVATHLAAGGIEGAERGERVVGLVERDRRPRVIEHLGGLDDLLVVDDHGVWLLDPSQVARQDVPRPLDPTTPLWQVVDLDGGDQVGGPDQAGLLRRRRDVLTAAQLVGSAGATTDLAVAHAGARQQFGKAIGAFQAVKHLCADMLARAEVARASVHAAAVALDDPAASATFGGSPDAMLAGACLLAHEAAIRNAKACIQVHGGMGFTWEVDVHLHLKRATVWGATSAGPDRHAEAVAAAL